MHHTVVRALALGGTLALLFSGCEGSISDPKVSPQELGCDSKQVGSRFSTCASANAIGTRYSAVQGNTHTGARFAVHGSLQGVLR